METKGSHEKEGLAPADIYGEHSELFCWAVGETNAFPTDPNKPIYDPAIGTGAENLRKPPTRTLVG